MIFGIRFQPVLRFCDFISNGKVMCFIIKGENYVGNKIIILANESTYFI